VRVRIGTRGSALARAQTEIVAAALAKHDIDHDIIVIETAGDRRAPDTPWGEGAFVSAIEESLVDGRIDAAVHSAKDIPTEEDPRLSICAYLAREEPRDALVLPNGKSGSLDTLPPGASIGTDSPRRTGFLRARRPDLDVRPLHGNVDTRLRRLDEGAADALLLAAAGLIRLGRADRISQVLPVDMVPPAPGQGAIAVQVRADDSRTAEIVARVDDMPTRQAVEAERTLLSATGGGCRAPIGALAKVEGETIEIAAGFATLDGRAAGIERDRGNLAQAREMAVGLAARLVARRNALPGAPRVLVTRPTNDGQRLTARLAEFGVVSAIVPAIDTEILSDSPELDDALRGLAQYDWAVVTSRNGVRAAAQAAHRLSVDLARVRWAAVGKSTARELWASGVRDVWMSPTSNAESVGRELPLSAGARVLWLRGDLADDRLFRLLVERGGKVHDIVAYRTVIGPPGSRSLLARELAAGRLDAVALASPSAVRGLVQLAGDDLRQAVLGIPAVCIGPRTTAAARDAGFTVIGESSSQDSSALAEEIARVLAGTPAGVAR
jgi:hydroxymethylbilane synthase